MRVARVLLLFVVVLVLSVVLLLASHDAAGDGILACVHPWGGCTSPERTPPRPTSRVRLWHRDLAAHSVQHGAVGSSGRAIKSLPFPSFAGVRGGAWLAGSSERVIGEGVVGGGGDHDEDDDDDEGDHDDDDDDDDNDDEDEGEDDDDESIGM